MTGWLLSIGWHWLLVPILVWLARGVWVALMKPELVYRTHVKIPTKGTLVTLRRQERWPPWRADEETWMLIEDRAFRESDGQPATKQLAVKIRSAMRIAEARSIETELLASSVAPISLRYAVVSFIHGISARGTPQWEKMQWHADEDGATRWIGPLPEAIVIARSVAEGRDAAIVVVAEVSK